MIVDLSLSAPPGADDVETTTGPTPQDPTSGLSQDSTEITAGLGGFLVVFALGLALWVLGRDMTRRLRRLDHREATRVRALTDDPAGQAGRSGAPEQGSGRSGQTPG